jgi:cell division septation protein DedD
LAVTTSDEDGFREIQLSGKQLVFLFMAVTVVLVVTFLTGVLVGRGVRAERAEAARTDALTEAPATPERTAPAVAETSDPRMAPPPTPADDADADTRAAKAEESEEPPVAAPRTQPAETVAVPPEKPSAAASEKRTPARVPPAASASTASASPASPTPAAPVAAATTTTNRSGYAVQVAAVNVRSEADSIARRLTGKGYAAYIEVPKGSTSMFRVRVGTFKTRREAQTVADKLKKEEKFKPWVTR